MNVYRAQDFQIPHTIYLIPSRILHLKHLHIKILLQKGIQYIQIHSITLKATPVLDFAKFIARRELVTTGLTKFDDNPENFRAWESSFINATQDLQLSASEELDLLVKWLGKESSDNVRRIRAVYVTNPQAAL